MELTSMEEIESETTGGLPHITRSVITITVLLRSERELDTFKIALNGSIYSTEQKGLGMNLTIRAHSVTFIIVPGSV